MNVYAILGGIFLAAALFLGGVYTGEHLDAGKRDKAALASEAHAITQSNVQTTKDEQGFAVTAKTIEHDDTTLNRLQEAVNDLPLLTPAPSAITRPIPFSPAFGMCWNAASSDRDSPACEAGAGYGALSDSTQPVTAQFRPAPSAATGVAPGAGPHR